MPEANPLGTLIDDEANRAEADLASTRARGQGVLSISGLLIAGVGAVLAFASAGKSVPVKLDLDVHVALILALGAFTFACVTVLFLFRPTKVEWPKADALTTFAQEDWEAEGWDQSVAVVKGECLQSLRKANKRATRQLLVAIRLPSHGSHPDRLYRRPTHRHPVATDHA